MASETEPSDMYQLFGSPAELSTPPDEPSTLITKVHVETTDEGLLSAGTVVDGWPVR